MTSQQQADEALSVWRDNRNNPEVETMLDRVLAPTVTIEHTQVFAVLLDSCFRFPTQHEADDVTRSVTTAMSSEPALRPAKELDFSDLEF